MAKNSIRDFSATASLNTDIQSVDIDENCAASGINNAIRELMADLADVDSGTVALTSPQVDSLTLNGNATFGDGDNAYFGDGNDLQIYHSGSHSFVQSVGTGSLRLRNLTDDFDVLIESDDGSGGIATYIQADGSTGAVKLNHYGSQKLATTSTGVDITGDLSVSGSISGAGKVLQVKQTAKTNVFTTTSTSFVDITNLSVTITPTSSTSKIMVEFHIGAHTTDIAEQIRYKIVRDSTDIGIGDSGNGTRATIGATTNGNRGEGVSMKFLDSPATTSSITYKIQACVNGSGTLDINTRSGNYSAISTITVMEIGA